MGRRCQRTGKKGIYHKNKNFKIVGGRKQEMGRRRQRTGKKGIYHKNKNFKISRGRKQEVGRRRQVYGKKGMNLTFIFLYKMHIAIKIEI
jgi:hypothetical protein